jgi:hypothetical protein
MLPKIAFSVCWGIASLAVVADSQAFTRYQQGWTVEGWHDRRDFASDITLDAAGNLYAAGSTGDVYGTRPSGLYSGAVAAKFDSDGNRHWLSNAYATASLDHVADVRVDGSGNVFISGETYRYTTGAEAYLVKFSSDGTRLWERHLGTPDNEFGVSLTVDTLGNAYLGGSTTGDLVGGGKHGYDPFVAKYDSNGSLQWIKQYADPTINAYPSSMSMSPGYGIYLGFGGTIDGGLARLDEAGEILWFQKPNYSATSLLHTDIYGVTSDAEGNVYATGISDFAYTNGSLFSGGTAVVAKHAPDGTLLWSEKIPTLFQSSATDVTLDSLGNVYICGGLSRAIGGSTTGDSDAFWAKFSPQGDLLWFEQWGTEFSESASGLSVDQVGRVFVVANQARNLNDYYGADGDIFLIRFDPVPEPAAISLVMIMALTWASISARR